jgi:eukaryotic-like serine/threonine-protein kinase
VPMTADGSEIAWVLVAAGKLTRYQADAILARRLADLLIGNYEILDRLGAGGMGTVFKARHRRMKRIVALKVLSREVAATEEFVSRFQREVETIARLTHPNIVMAFDADECEAGPFLVMEFVNGRDLTSEVAANGPLPVADAVDRILQAARGLDYAHRQGIIHRDIKPGNLLRDADGTVKVADLGLARISRTDGQTSLTQAGSVFGTIDYMSPEQALDSREVDARADVYSLGCTLYFLLAGRAPYGGGSLMGVMLKHRDSPVPSLRAARPDVPPDLDAIFARMVAKRPEDRQATMAEVIQQLDQVRPKLPAGGAVLPGGSRAAPASDSLDRTVALDSPLASTSQHAFSVDLPAGGSAVQSGATPASLARLTVVIAEPSRTQAGIVRNYLKQIGIEAAHSTGSGREAIDTVKRVGARVLISSLHLLDMTGVQLATALRADPDCGNVGFVLATSEANPEFMAGLPAGPRTVVVPKPFDLARLTQVIAAVTDGGTPT